MEVESLILIRNEIAKWHKKNTRIKERDLLKSLPFQNNSFEDAQDLDGEVQIHSESAESQIVKLPPMSKKKNTCERCFSKEVCSIAALSLESESKRHPDSAKFEMFKEISEKATLQIRRYFKKFVECINLEQSAENNRQESSYTTGSNKE